MNTIYNDGVEVTIEEETYTVKLSVLCCITDLPAKAETLNMSYFNGEYACITCTEPGLTVAQGKGHTKCFPYRNAESRYSRHSDESIIINMNEGSNIKRSKGFKGMSELANLQSYNIVDGQGQYGERDLVKQAEDYILCAEKHPLRFRVPKVHFIFYNQVTIPMAEALEKLGIGVWGERVIVERDIEEKLVDFSAMMDDSNDDDDDDGDDSDGDDDDGLNSEKKQICEEKIQSTAHRGHTISEEKSGSKLNNTKIVIKI
ncbi:hypothetical protein KUTeg_008466 [Tegillarca granosa]|uniref:DUF5614 domain-containing protein n=1 Tax=Tegillarca granosa TaxID=220873 RepID=A0ABQ9FE27_TEGGR|nr:hypothetical protein KUTeg_008466 [Tegillarca granosa]